MSKKTWLRIAGLSGFLAVGLGAFGAHFLRQTLEQQASISTWQTATHYQLFHSVATALPAAQLPRRYPPAYFFSIGMLLFSGSLYVMAMTQNKSLGIITPLGGLFFLAGWYRLATASAVASESNLPQTHTTMKG